MHNVINLSKRKSIFMISILILLAQSVLSQPVKIEQGQLLASQNIVRSQERNDALPKFLQPKGNITENNQVSLSQALNDDGSLKLGLEGSFDPAGYNMSYGTNGEPIFYEDNMLSVSDEPWKSLPDYGGISGQVYAIALSGGNVYVGGTFSNAGGNSNADNIAVWDGANWSALGTGLNENVSTIAVGAGNLVYAGGRFTNAGGNLNADYAAVWNGANWSSLGSALNSFVYSIAVSGSTVYVGGAFTDAGGIASADNIAVSNGSSWSALGTGLNNRVYAIVVSGSNVYVGGDFIDAGGNASADRIARWNGSSWNAIGAGLNGRVNTIYIDGGHVYAGGNFVDAGGNPDADRIAYWNGSSWSSLGNGLNFEVYSLARIQGGYFCVGGAFTNAGGNDDADNVAIWNPFTSSWEAMGSGLVNEVYAVASMETQVYVGNNGGIRIGTRGGSTWSGLGVGLKNGVNAIAISGTNIYVGGSFTDAGGNPNADYIVQWNGIAWNALGNGLNGEVKTLAVNGSMVYVGGNFTDAGGNVNADYIALWDGSFWSPLGVGLNAPLTAIALSGTNLYVAGGFEDAGGNINADRIALWNGSSWNALGTGINGIGLVYAIAVSGNNVYVGGTFEDAGGNLNADRIALWNGSSWNSLGSGLNAKVHVITVSGSNVYVGGEFTDAGGNTNADRIARWNGTSWSALGSGFNSHVSAIAIQGTNVYIGGSVWNGNAWLALGSGLNGSVSAIAISDVLYVGGSFTGTNGGSTSAINIIQRNAILPTAIVQTAETVTLTEVSLKGIVNRNGGEGTYYFQYGTTSNSLINQTDVQSIAESGNIEISANVLSGTPNTTYFYRLRVENEEGVSYSELLSYTFPSDIDVRQTSNSIASGNEYDFGNINYLASSSSIGFTIHNLGLGNLILTGSTGSYVVKGGAHAADFTVTQSGVTSPINYNDSKSFTIQFAPSASGLRTATLTITSNDPNEGSYVINLKGTGVKLNQTITFASLPVKTIGDASFVLSATVTSGLALSYVSGSPSVATVSGNTVTMVGPGSTVITASQAGNTSYNAAANVQQTLIVRSVEPAAQPTALTFSSITSSSMNGSFTAATGLPAGYLVLQKAGSSPTDVPVDGTSYSVGADLGTSKIVSIGSTTFSSTGLSSGVDYYYDVFAYNGSGVTINYRVTSPLEGNQATLVVEPIAQPTALIFSTVTSSSMDASFTPATGNPSGYLVLRKIDSTPTGAPVDATSYTLNQPIGDGNVAYFGPATNFSQSGLSAFTNYHYRIFSYNGSGSTINYLTSTPLTGSKTTLANEPTAQPTALSFTNVTINSQDASFTAAGGADGYLVLRRTGSAPTFVPSDGTVYTAGTSQGDSQVISVGSATSFNNTILTANTVYHYAVYSYRGAGQATNYLTTLPLSGNRSTLVNEPALAPTALTFSTFTVNSLSGSFTTTTADGYLVLQRASNSPTSPPIDGTIYTVGTSIGDGMVVAVGAIATFSATSLIPNTVYHYDVIAYNGTGNSINYNTNSILEGSRTTLQTEPTAQPTAIIFNNITISSLSGSFTAAAGAPSGYLVLRKQGSVSTGVPADGSTYTTGASIGDGEVLKVGAATDFTEVGLISGSLYHYSIFSYNGVGAATNYFLTNPAIADVITITATPATSAATIVQQSSFTANWTSVTGAASYVLDVSDNNFSTLFTGYAAKSVNGTSDNVTGLTPGTTYQYRVRAVNASGLSANSNTTSQITIPNTPTANPGSDIRTNDFKATWSSETGVSGYELEVSSNNFATTITGYGPKQIPSSLTEETVFGLSPSTEYKFRVKAINAGGKSDYSNEASARTLSSSGIALTVSTPSFVNSSTASISITLTNGSGARIVKFFSKGILASSFTSSDLSSTTNTYSTNVNPSMLDDLGLEFYFTASDASVSSPIETGRYFIYKVIDAASSSAIPFSSKLDGTSATYEMFSIPFQLDRDDIASVFRDLGGYDQTEWRLFHYENDKTVEYTKGLNNIELGKGYWFNSILKTDVKPGAGVVAEANLTKSFQITLAKGWNQIGNPYLFNVDWAAIKDANLPAGLNSLWSFESGSYIKKNVLGAWKGAFVFSDNGGVVSFPIASKTSASGRTSQDGLTAEIDESAWQLPITLTLNGLLQISGVGMHPEANSSKDRFDEIVMPRFIDYIEMSTDHPEFFANSFATDIVQTGNTQSWVFTLKSSQKEGAATLTWDQSTLLNSQAEIVLLDIHNQALVNMKSTGVYSFNWSEGRQFKIIYAREGELLPGITLLGNASPNPFRNTVSIPVLLEENQTFIQVHLYDLLGRKVKTIIKSNVGPGIHEIEWDGKDDQGTEVDHGLYLYQLRGNKGILSPSKRVIKQ